MPLFFTWHVALGHWHYWFKNNNMVAVWTPFMSISIKHLHTVICFALFFRKPIPLPNIVGITNIIILSQHESPIRFTYCARSFYVTVNNAYAAESQRIKSKHMCNFHCQDTLNFVLNVFANEQRIMKSRKKDAPILCFSWVTFKQLSHKHPRVFSIRHRNDIISRDRTTEIIHTMKF